MLQRDDANTDRFHVASMSHGAAGNRAELSIFDGNLRELVEVVK
jgi:hypothetical protein